MMFLHEQDLNGCLDFNVNHYRENVDFDECYFITLYKPALGISDGEARHIVKEGRASGWWGVVDQDYHGYGHLDELYHLPTGLCVGYFPSVHKAVQASQRFNLSLNEKGAFKNLRHGFFHQMYYAIRHLGMTFDYNHKSEYFRQGMMQDINRITKDLNTLDRSVLLRSYIELNGDLFNPAEFEHFAGSRRMMDGLPTFTTEYQMTPNTGYEDE